MIHKQAIADIDKAIQLAPSARNYYNRGVIKYMEAIDEIERTGEGMERWKLMDDFVSATTIDPSHSKSYYMLSQIFMPSDLALDYLNEAIELDTKLSPAYFLRSIYYEK